MRKKVQVKLVNGRVGIGFTQNPGQVISVEEADAKRMIERGQANSLSGRELAETATESRGENRSG